MDHDTQNPISQHQQSESALTPDDSNEPMALKISEKKKTTQHQDIEKNLISLWDHYKQSHISNLLYAVGFIAVVITAIKGEDGIIKNANPMAAAFIFSSLIFAGAAAGFAMLQRMSAQFFMEYETLPAETSMDDYYVQRGSLDFKVTNSYKYSGFVLELTRLVHNVTKVLAGPFLYLAGLQALFAVLSIAKVKHELRLPPVFEFIIGQGQAVLINGYLFILFISATFAIIISTWRSFHLSKALKKNTGADLHGTLQIYCDRLKTSRKINIGTAIFISTATTVLGIILFA